MDINEINMKAYDLVKLLNIEQIPVFKKRVIDEEKYIGIPEPLELNNVTEYISYQTDNYGNIITVSKKNRKY